jgi:hypothetical protein
MPFQVRRIQLKFRNEGDFGKALNTLADLGFPITESGSNSTSVSRPSISPAQLPFSSASTPNPAMETLGLQLSSLRPTPSTGITLSPKSEFKIPIRPETRNSEIPRSCSVQSFGPASVNRPASASTTFSAPTPPSSVSTVSSLYDTTKHLPSLYPIQQEERVLLHCCTMQYRIN